MMINGKWYDNISCPKCRYRHPAGLSCHAAAAAAQIDRDRRKAFEPEPTPEPPADGFQLKGKGQLWVDGVGPIDFTDLVIARAP
jgi:hypothetical protein